MAPSYIIPALARSFEVIDYISKAPQGVTFSEIVNYLQAPKASIYRILHTLESASWVARQGDKYHLDYMFIHYGMLTLSRRDLPKVAGPYLQQLTKELGETTHLAVLSGKQSMLAAVCESQHHIKLSSPVGTLLPLNCTSHGKIFLAWAVTTPLEAFLKDVELVSRTTHSLTTVDALKEEISRIRQQGYALDNLEFFDDIRCCAAPVFDGTGRCVGAIGTTATAVRFPLSAVAQISAKVKSTAAAISEAMGKKNS
ncbi:IclR family transcriptional regulator [Pelobacter seleniigenes]|uniref:IclR family transcriptional regulator n=1 Tax=Pelobacter seleniigenes TaxID=407188 RepID=UPI0004A77B55|nr:IclR family transcriptional regulator [Pelobacter seleniigenes]